MKPKKKKKNQPVNHWSRQVSNNPSKDLADFRDLQRETLDKAPLNWGLPVEIQEKLDKLMRMWQEGQK